MTPLRSLTLAALLLLAPHARAEGDEAPAEAPAGPDHGKMATADATPVGRGAVEIELAYSPTFSNRGSGSFERSSHAHSHAYGLAAAYGVTDEVDVTVAGGLAYAVDLSDPTGATRGSGGTDLAFAGRWRFLADADRALDLAVISTVVAPTGLEARDDRLGLTQGYWSLRNAVVASQDWGRTTANAELAYTVPVSGGAGELDGALSANLAVGHAVLRWLQPFAEASYDLVSDALRQERLALTAGVNVTPDAGPALLVGVQQAVWGRNVTQSTTALVAMKTAF